MSKQLRTIGRDMPEESVYGKAEQEDSKIADAAGVKLGGDRL